MPETDISELSITKGETAHPHKRGTRAILVICLVLTVPLCLVGYKYRSRLLPAPEVTVSQVIALEGGESTHRPTNTVLFQAAGWIEPAPFVTKATALINGVVETVHVIEGQSVKKGDPLVTFIDDDILLEKKQLDAHKRKVQAQLLKSESNKETSEADLAQLKAQIKTAGAQLAELTYDYNALKSIETITPKRAVEKARLAMKTQQTKCDAITQRTAILESMVKSRSADITIAKSELSQVDASMEANELSLARTTVHAPIDGIIMRFKSYVGAKHVINGDDTHSATIAELFQPDSLQVRVDVPLQEAGGLRIGQRAKIKVDILPNTVFEGTVTSLAGAADIQRNTLQAKVAIKKPAPIFRPEMLARVEFLSPATPSSSPEQTSTTTLVFVDKSCLVNQRQSTASVWVIDPLTENLTLENVELGTLEKDGWVAVINGLRPGQQTVRDPSPELRIGQRVEVAQ